MVAESKRGSGIDVNVDGYYNLVSDPDWSDMVEGVAANMVEIGKYLPEGLAGGELEDKVNYLKIRSISNDPELREERNERRAAHRRKIINRKAAATKSRKKALENADRISSAREDVFWIDTQLTPALSNLPDEAFEEVDEVVKSSLDVYSAMMGEIRQSAQTSDDPLSTLNLDKSEGWRRYIGPMKRALDNIHEKYPSTMAPELPPDYDPIVKEVALPDNFEVDITRDDDAIATRSAIDSGIRELETKERIAQREGGELTEDEVTEYYSLLEQRDLLNRRGPGATLIDLPLMMK